MDSRSLEIDDVLKATQTDDFPHHKKVRNSYQTSKLLLKNQFSNLESTKDLCKSTEEISNKLAEFVSNSLLQLKKMNVKSELVQLREHTDEFLKKIESKRETLSQLPLKVETSIILLNNCSDLIVSAGDVIKHVDQKLLRLEEKEKKILHEVHDLMALEKKWIVDARNVFSLDLMAIEDEQEMDEKLFLKKKYQNAIPKHKANLKKITGMFDALVSKDVSGVKELGLICQQLALESEEVIRSSEEQDEVFEKAMAEETLFYSQLEELYSWMEKAGDILQSRESLSNEEVFIEFEEYSQKFVNICQRSIEISKRHTSFNSQMEQIKSQWNDICCHLTRLRRSKNTKIIKEEQYQILASTQPLEKQLLNIVEFMEKLEAVEAIDEEVEQQKKVILSKKHELENAALLRDKMKTRYKEDVENVVISVEEYVIDVDDPDYEHVIEILYNNQSKLETAATSIQDMKKQGEELKKVLPLDDYREFVECVTEVEEIFYEKQSDHAKMGLIVQVEKQFRGVDIILKGLADLGEIEDLNERIGTIDENRRSLFRLSKELSNSIELLQTLGCDYYPLIVQSIFEKIEGTIPLIDLHLESLKRSSDDCREVLVNFMDGKKQTEDYLENLNQTEIFYNQEIVEVNCLYNTKVVLSTVSIAIKDHHEALDKMLSYCNFFIEKFPEKKRRTLFGCLESCRNKTHELEDRVTLQDALLTKKMMILNGIEIQVHTIETAAQQASEIISLNVHFDINAMNRMLSDFKTTLENISRENEIFLEELPMIDNKEIISLLKRVEMFVDNLIASLVENCRVSSNESVDFIELPNISAREVLIEYLPENVVPTSLPRSKSVSKMPIYYEADCVEKQFLKQESLISSEELTSLNSEAEVISEKGYEEELTPTQHSSSEIVCVVNGEDHSIDGQGYISRNIHGPITITINGEKEEEDEEESCEEFSANEHDLDQDCNNKDNPSIDLDMNFSSCSTKDFDESTEIRVDNDEEDFFDQLANDIFQKPKTSDGNDDMLEKVRLLKLALNKHLVVVGDLKEEIGQPLDQLEEMFEQNQRLSSIFHKHKTIYQLLCQHYQNEIADQLELIDVDRKDEIQKLIKNIYEEHVEFTKLLEENAKHLNECQDVKFEAEQVLRSVKTTLNTIEKRLADIKQMDSLDQIKLAVEVLKPDLDSVRDMVDFTNINASKLTPFDFDYIEQEMISSNVNFSNLISNFYCVEMNCRDNIELKRKARENLEGVRKDISCLETTLIRYKSFTAGLDKEQMKTSIESQYLQISLAARETLSLCFDSFPSVDHGEMQALKCGVESEFESLGDEIKAMDDEKTVLVEASVESESSKILFQYSAEPAAYCEDSFLTNHQQPVNVENTLIKSETQPEIQSSPIQQISLVDEVESSSSVIDVQNKPKRYNQNESTLAKQQLIDSKVESVNIEQQPSDKGDNPGNNFEVDPGYTSLFSAYEFGFTKNSDDLYDDDTRPILHHGSEDVSSWLEDNSIQLLQEFEDGSDSDDVKGVETPDRKFSLLDLHVELKSIEEDLMETDMLSVIERKKLSERLKSKLAKIETFLGDFEANDSTFKDFSAVCITKNTVNELLCDLEMNLEEQLAKKETHEECIENGLRQLQEIEEMNDAQQLNIDLNERVRIIENYLVRLREVDELVSSVFNEGSVFHMLPASDQDQLERQFTMFVARFIEMEESLSNQMKFLKQKLVLKNSFDEKCGSLGGVCNEGSIEMLQLDLSLFRGVLSNSEQETFDSKMEKFRSILVKGSEKAKPDDKSPVKQKAIEVEKHPIQQKPAIEVETPQIESQPIIEVETTFIQQKPIVEDKTPQIQQQPIVQVKTSTIEQQPIIEIETHPIQHKPTIEVETPQKESQPIIEVKTTLIQQKPTIEVKTTLIQQKPTIEDKTPKNESQPIIKVEKSQIEKQSIIEDKTPHIESQLIVNVKTLTIEQQPTVEVETSLVKQKTIEVETHPIQAKPAIEVETPQIESQPIIEVETSSIEQHPTIEVETPKIESEPMIEVETSPIEQHPTIEVETPKIESESMIEVKTLTIQQKPAIEDKTPKKESQPIIKVEKSQIEKQPIIEDKTPHIESQSTVEVETPKIESEPTIEFKTLTIEQQPGIKIETRPIQQQPTIEVETPKKESQPIIEVETHPIQHTPTIEVETPKKESQPIIEVETHPIQHTPTIEVETPQKESQPIIEVETHPIQHTPTIEVETPQKESQPIIEVETHPIQHTPTIEVETPQKESQPIIEVETHPIQHTPTIEVETPQKESQPIIEVETHPIQQKPAIEDKTPKKESQPIIKVETHPIQHTPIIEVETPKKESQPIIEVETHPIQHTPTIEVETPKKESQPIIKVETHPIQHTPTIEVETPKKESQPIIEIETTFIQQKPTIEDKTPKNELQSIIKVETPPIKSQLANEAESVSQQPPEASFNDQISGSDIIVDHETEEKPSINDQNQIQHPPITESKLLLKDEVDEIYFSALNQIPDEEKDEGELVLSLDQVKSFVLETLEKAVNKLNEYEKIETDRFGDVTEIIDALDSLNMRATQNEIANCQVLLTSLAGSLREEEADDLQAEIISLLHCFEETSEEVNKRTFDLRKALILQTDYEEDLSRLSERLTQFREINEKQEPELSLNDMQKQLIKDKATLGSLQKELKVVQDQRVKLNDQLPEKVYSELMLMENEFHDELSAVASSIVKESSYLENLQASKRTLSLTIIKQASAIETFKDDLKTLGSKDIERLKKCFDSLKKDWHATKPVIAASYKNLPTEDSKEVQTYSDHLDEQLRVLETQLNSQDLSYKLIDQKFLDWKDGFEHLKSAWKDINSEDYTKELDRQNQITREIEKHALELGLIDQGIDNLRRTSNKEEFLGKVEDLKLSVENCSHEVKSLWIASKENLKYLEEGKNALDHWLAKYHEVENEEGFNEIENSFEEIRKLFLSFHQAECQKMLGELQQRLKESKDKYALQMEVKEKELWQLERIYKSTFNWLRTIRKSASLIDHNVNTIDVWLDEFVTTQSEFLNEKSDFEDLIQLLEAETAPGFVKKVESLKNLVQEVENTLARMFDRLTQGVKIRDEFLSALQALRKDLTELEIYLKSSNQEGELSETLVMQSTLDQGFDDLTLSLDELSTKIPGMEFNQYRIQMESFKERVSQSKQNVFDLYTRIKSKEEALVDVKAVIEAAHEDISEINGVIARVSEGVEQVTPTLLTQTECRLLEVSLWVKSCLKDEGSLHDELNQLLESFNCAVENSKHLLKDLREKIRRFDEFETKTKTLESLVALLADGSERSSYHDLNLEEVLRELNEIGQQVECANLVETQREKALSKIERIKERCSNLLKDYHQVKLAQKKLVLDSISEMKEFVLTVYEDLPIKDDETLKVESMSYLTDLLNSVRLCRDKTGEMLQKMIEHSLSSFDDKELLVQINETKDSLSDIRDTISHTEAKILQEISVGSLNQSRCEDIETKIASLSERQKILKRSLEGWRERDSVEEILSFLKSHQEIADLLNKDISLLASHVSSFRQNQSFNTELDCLLEKLESKQSLMSSNINKLETIPRKLLKNFDKINCAQFQQVLNDHNKLRDQDLLNVQLRLTYAKLLRRKTKLLDLLSSGTDEQKRVFASIPEVIDTVKKLECYEQDYEMALKDLEISLIGSQTGFRNDTTVDDSFYLGDVLKEEEFEEADMDSHNRSFGLEWFKEEEKSRITPLVEEQIHSERFVESNSLLRQDLFDENIKSQQCSKVIIF